MVEDDAEVCKNIANLGALIKTEAADDAIAYVHPPQRFFQGAGLRRGAIEDGDTCRWVVAENLGDFAADIFGFAGRVACFVETQQFACTERRLQILTETRTIFLHHAAGGVEDCLRGAIVFLEANCAGAGEIFQEALKIAAYRAPPTVYRLVLIADDADISILSGEQAHQFLL